ncbi:histidine kinase [Pseudomonas sp. NW5]|uniref:histidine kinase n=1 Tax=Pseudomonas sp. NW5 TaxID=2934934 RepID=UPI0020203C69|nr:histidine kinase [Pseudomonas sp. NW5]MCL7461114.1 histidine kinase [Pseudomonas sp. NW5]
MSRPSPVKSDNLFVSMLGASQRRRFPLTVRLVLHTLLLLGTCLLVFIWVTGLQLRQATDQQAIAVGEALRAQAVTAASDLLVANDRLSLNVMLDKLVDNPLVAHAVIQDANQRVSAEAGQRPLGAWPPHTDNITTFSAPIAIQDDRTAAQLYLTLDRAQLAAPLADSLQNLGILAAILMTVALAFSLRLGSQLSVPLLQLRLWLRDPIDNAPALERQDEIGDLARQLDARLAPPPELQPEPEPPFEQDDEMLLDTIRADLDDSVPQRVRARQSSAATPATSLTAAEPDEPDFDLDFALDLEEPDEIDTQQHRPAPAQPAPAQASPAAPRPLSARRSVLEDEEDFGLQAADLGLDNEPFVPAAAPIAPAPQPVAQAAPSVPADAVAERPIPSAVLCVQLGGQHELQQLPRPRLLALLQRYRDCLDEATRTYQGSLYSLDDGGSLILFHDQQQDERYLVRALCCGELLRILSHELQVLIADSGLTLQLQLAISRGNNLYGLTQGELLLQPASQQAIALSRDSRNLVLLDAGLSGDPQLQHYAQIRSINSPAGASCIKSLQPPLPAELEQQLGRILGTP